MRRYLLLDDNEAFAENLAESSATVATRHGGDGWRRALELARTTRFDVLLTDMRMPGMSGAAAVHHLRQVDPGLAAVVITAYPGEDDLETARREGLLAVLPSPSPSPRSSPCLRGGRDGLVALVEDDLALSDNLSELLRSRASPASPRARCWRPRTRPWCGPSRRW
jgi:CheY-like chemotaxis protein